jgi:hypothetical protein
MPFSGNSWQQLAVGLFAVARRSRRFHFSGKRVNQELRTRSFGQFKWYIVRSYLAVLLSAVTVLAFVDDLDIVTVRIKHPGRIIARIVFGTSLRWFLTLSSSC